MSVETLADPSACGGVDTQNQSGGRKGRAGTVRTPHAGAALFVVLSDSLGAGRSFTWRRQVLGS